MLPTPPKELTEAVLREACADGWPETQTLDFKWGLPGTTDEDRAEFAKDICAFANADGGDLVYGISDRNARANEIVPIQNLAPDTVRRRLTQMLDAIEPRISSIRMEPVHLATGGFVWILRVPSSFDAPHTHRRDGLYRFALRNGTLTSDMSYDQIRTAFDRSTALAARAQAFRDGRNATIASPQNTTGAGPLVVVHVIPLSAMTARKAVDVGALHDGNYTRFAQRAWGAVTTRTLNLDGLRVHPGVEVGQVPLAYSLIFRSGCFEAVRNVGHAHMGPLVIPSTVLAGTVCDMVSKFVQGAVDFGYSGPAIIAVSLLRVDGTRLGLGERYTQQIAPMADRPHLVVPETWIESLEAFGDVHTVVRPILDTLWQSFDEPRCREYDTDGHWNGGDPFLGL
jgi:hypothetical protein